MPATMSRCVSLLFGLAFCVAAGANDFNVNLRMTVSETAEFTKDKVGSAIVAGIAAAIDGVNESMVAITSIGDAPATPAPTPAPVPTPPTPSPTGDQNATETATTTLTTTPASTGDENATVTVTSTAAPTGNENATENVTTTTAPTRRLRSRRLASGEMLVVVAFTGVPDTITEAVVESKLSDVMVAINNELNGTEITGLIVEPPSPAPTPPPTPGATTTTGSPVTDAAVISRLDLWIVGLALLLGHGRA